MVRSSRSLPFENIPSVLAGCSWSCRLPDNVFFHWREVSGVQDSSKTQTEGMREETGDEDVLAPETVGAASVHLVLLLSSLRALVSITGTSSEGPPPGIARSEKCMLGVLVSNTHMAPSWVQKLPAGIRCEPVAMVMSEENVAVPVEP